MTFNAHATSWILTPVMAATISITSCFLLAPVQGRQTQSLWETPHSIGYRNRQARRLWKTAHRRRYHNASDNPVFEVGVDPATSANVEDYFAKTAREAREVESAVDGFISAAGEVTLPSKSGVVPRWSRPPPDVNLLTTITNARGSSKNEEHLDHVKAERRARREGLLVDTPIPHLTKASFGVNITQNQNVSVADKTHVQLATQTISNATAFLVMSITSVLLLGCGTGLLLRVVGTARRNEQVGGDENDPANRRTTICCCSLGASSFMFLGGLVVFACVGFWMLWSTNMIQDALKELVVYVYLLILLVACACLSAIEVYTDIAFLTENARTVGKAAKRVERLVGDHVPGADPDAPDGAVTGAAKHVYQKWGGFSRSVDETIERLMSGRARKPPEAPAASSGVSAATATATANANAKATGPQPAAVPKQPAPPPTHS
jgi:hypothetical protein